MVEISPELQAMGKKAQAASKILRLADSQSKNDALLKMAQALLDNSQSILDANQKDIEAGRENGLTEALIERLTLTEDRVKGMAGGLEKMASLADPISQTDAEWINENGLRISRRRVPLGVIAIIYESRPNVTADATGLSLKAGNAVILRGGKEALNSNLAIEAALHKGLAQSDLPETAVQVIPSPDREYSNQLMAYNEAIDVLIPRGGAGLIQAVVKNATVPVIETGVGNTHIYIENSADLEKAKNILHNAKTQRPSVCNAAENLVIDQDIAEKELANLAQPLIKAGVTLYGDEKTRELLPEAKTADESHYQEEFLDLELAIKVVSGYKEAIEHIERYSSQHSDAIVTESYELAEAFLNDIDSATVYVNASTRFTDGEVFGFGGEIGISTQKLHARGPMGLEALTTYKYAVRGNGQVRE